MVENATDTHSEAVMNLIKRGSESPSTLWHRRTRVGGNVWTPVQRKGICCSASKSSRLHWCHHPSSTWLLLFTSPVPMTRAISCMMSHYTHTVIWACCLLTHDAHVRYVFLKYHKTMPMWSQLILLTLNENVFPLCSLKFQSSASTYVQVYTSHPLQQQFS